MQKEKKKQNKGNRGSAKAEKRREGDYGTWLVILRNKGVL